MHIRPGIELTRNDLFSGYVFTRWVLVILDDKATIDPAETLAFWPGQFVGCRRVNDTKPAEQQRRRQPTVTFRRWRAFTKA